MDGNDSSESDTPLKALTKRATLLAAALVPPVTGVFAAGVDWLKQHPLLATMALIVYWLLITVSSFTAEVFRKLKPLWVDRVAKWLDGRLQLRINRFEPTYLNHVAASNKSIDLHGLTTRGEFTLSLTEAFVQTTVEPSATTRLESATLRAPSTKPEARADRSIWYWLQRTDATQSVLVIIGPPGSGKTTLLRHIAFELAVKSAQLNKDAAKKRPLPVFLPFRDIGEHLAGPTPPPLADVIAQQLSLSHIIAPPRWFEEQLRRGRVIVLVDGMDELATPELRTLAAKWIGRQQELYPECTYVTSSRPFGYKNNPLPVATVLQVDEFDSHQMEDFIRRWYSATSRRSYGSDDASAQLAAEKGARDLIRRINASVSLRAFAANPLLLTMMANVHNYRGALPGTRAELYKEVCTVFLGARHQARGVHVALQAGQKQAVLQKLAYDMTADSTSNVKSDTAKVWIADAIERVSAGMRVDTFLKMVEDSSGLLIEKESGTYSFAHQTFQEYLAAMYVRESGKVEMLTSRVTDPYWHEVIRLFCAESDASRIIEACLNHQSDVGSLRLAVECLEEAREVDPEARRRLLASVSPEGVRSDPLARQLSARVNMLLRLNRFRQIAPDVSIAEAPVTCLEYQYYLDNEPAAFPPASWGSRIFPLGSEAEPVVGACLDDVVGFIKFFQREIGGTQAFDLPRIAEFDLQSPVATWTWYPSPPTAVWVVDESEMGSCQPARDADNALPDTIAQHVRSDISLFRAEVCRQRV